MTNSSSMKLKSSRLDFPEISSNERPKLNETSSKPKGPEKKMKELEENLRLELCHRRRYLGSVWAEWFGLGRSGFMGLFLLRLVWVSSCLFLLHLISLVCLPSLCFFFVWSRFLPSGLFFPSSCSLGFLLLVLWNLSL